MPIKLTFFINFLTLLYFLLKEKRNQSLALGAFLLGTLKMNVFLQKGKYLFFYDIQ